MATRSAGRRLRSRTSSETSRHRQIMTMMGIDLDAVGNHSFDRGQAYFRNELIPLAGFPLISANVVQPDGTTPTGWTPSKVIDFGHGVKVGFVGFTTESTPEVVFPGNLDPLEVRPVIPAVNAEAAKLDKKVDAIVALGHEGATGGTISDPTGDLIVTRGQRPERGRRDRRPRRSAGHLQAVERRARDREPRQGHPLHADSDRRRPRQGGRRLQDGRLPQAVDDRRHPECRDPGEDRRAQRTARTDPRHADRLVCDEGRSRGPTGAVAARAGPASRSLATSSPTRCALPTRGSASSSRSRTRAASGPT